MKYFLIIALFLSFKCKHNGEIPIKNNEINWYVTKADKSELIQKQNTVLNWTNSANLQYNLIQFDSSISFQTIDGFGFALTGGSAYLINQLTTADKNKLLRSLFSNDSNSIKISYIRISIGASDLDAHVFSYNDLAKNETDSMLSKFNIQEDEKNLIPILQQIIAINPNIKIMASPWSAPIWMKSNQSSIGGYLLPKYYSTYSNYFVKYIKAMQARGINIESITIQNEPQHGGNNPSMVFSWQEEANFVKNYLGPIFATNNIKTKIIIWDHNCDNPDYPKNILNDPEANKYIDGTAFHLYAGDVSAFANVHNAYPNKNLYFTEQWTGAKGEFAGDFLWHTENVIIGTLKNYSKVCLEWNLANDPLYNPHTPGGCTECKGALTIDGGNIIKNVSYYIIGQISKFVPPNSIRVSTSEIGNNIFNIGFITPAGKKILFILNKNNSTNNISVSYNNKYFNINVPEQSTSIFEF